MTNDNLFRGCGIEISINDPAKFLVIKETLTRIGIASRVERTLYQSVHILHKRSRYALMHFKELFKLDGRPSTITEDDLARRNTIALLLQEWGLVNLVGSGDIKLEPVAPIHHITIIPHREKQQWKLVAKYTIGIKKHDGMEHS